MAKIAFLGAGSIGFGRRQARRERLLSQARQQLAAGPLEVRRSTEYAARIIHAIETDTPCCVYGTVWNTGLISNLPNGCCVEVPCLARGAGIQPCYVGALLPQCAALCQTNVSMQALTVRAILERRREHVYHAAMLAPNTAAQLTLPQIRETLDRLLDAQVWLVPPLC